MTRHGVGLVIGVTELLKVVTAINYTYEFHGPTQIKVATARATSSQSAVFSVVVS